jgi:hypothetical protein
LAFLGGWKGGCRQSVPGSQFPVVTCDLPPPAFCPFAWFASFAVAPLLGFFRSIFVASVLFVVCPLPLGSEMAASRRSSQ